MNSLPSGQNKTPQNRNRGGSRLVDSVNFTSSAEADPTLEIEKLKIKYQHQIQVHSEMLEKYKLEYHDLEEKKKMLVNTIQENQVLDKMSEEVQLTKRRNQIAELHSTIQEQKD